MSPPGGGPGLPMVNGSTERGDLHIAHFIGIHTLQVLPLFGILYLFSVGYFLCASALFLQAMKRIPLFF